MSLFRLIFTSFLAPLHCRILKLIAYGPWGKFHQLLIWVFKTLYSIEWKHTSQFKTLGEFFLRSVPFHISSSPLLSPAEARLIEGPSKIDLNEKISIKGLQYSWGQFKEFDASQYSQGVYWNFYLAPHNYHWVHSAATGTNLQAYRWHGKKWPVNALGRKLAPNLYVENERLTFKFQTPEFGEVIMICVGAMGVSELYCDRGDVSYGQWVNLQKRVIKGERLLAFKLGSTVIMLVERAPPSLKQDSVVRVGDELV